MVLDIDEGHVKEARAMLGTKATVDRALPQRPRSLRPMRRTTTLLALVAGGVVVAGAVFLALPGKNPARAAATAPNTAVAAHPAARSGTVSTSQTKGATRSVSVSTVPPSEVYGTLVLAGSVDVSSKSTPCSGCEPGTVRLTASDGHRIDVKTAQSGKFAVRVPAGRYRVAGGLDPPYGWPLGSCEIVHGDGVHFSSAQHHRRFVAYFYVIVGKETKQRIDVICGTFTP